MKKVFLAVVQEGGAKWAAAGGKREQAARDPGDFAYVLNVAGRSSTSRVCLVIPFVALDAAQEWSEKKFIKVYLNRSAGGEKMKIAVASEQNLVSEHFGHCTEFTLFSVDPSGKIVEKIVLPSPAHQPGFLPGYLAQLGITHVIAGGIGQRAQALLAEKGITVIAGVNGPVEEAVQNFLANRLVKGINACCGHGHGEGDGFCHGGGEDKPGKRHGCHG